MSNWSTNIFCDRRLPTTGCLIGFVFSVGYRRQQGQLPSPSCTNHIKFLSFFEKKRKLQLPQKSTTAFSSWTQQYPACFDGKCHFTTNTKISSVLSRWEFVFRMRPNLSISQWQISGLRSVSRFPHTHFLLISNAYLMNPCREHKNLLMKCSFYLLLRTCTLVARD